MYEWAEHIGENAGLAFESQEGLEPAVNLSMA
jgi:hypothetical protein